MRRLAVLALCLPLLAGCSTLRTILPGGPTMADFEFDGVKSAEPTPIVGTLDERAGAALAVLAALGGERADPFGVLLPLVPIGATEPRWVLCPAGKMAEKCREIPLQATVHFVGRPIGPGLLWQPSLLTADHFDD